MFRKPRRRAGFRYMIRPRSRPANAQLILSDTVSGSSVAPREQYPSSQSTLLTCTDRANRAFRFRCRSSPVSARESRARSKTDEALVERAKKGEDRQLLVDVILPVLADPSVPDEQVGGILRGKIGMSRLREVMAGPWRPLPKDHGRLSALDASCTYLRQFTPNVLAAIDFKGGHGTTDLMAAVAILKTLNETGGRKVPADAPESFVPARYADYLAKAREGGDDTAYRHYWEPCVILGLRDGLRSGDVYVPGSRRYADPATYLYTPAQWKPRQAGYCRLVGKPARAADALEQGREELHTALAEMENALAGALPDDTGTVRLDAGDHLVIPKLTAEDIPAEARELKEELSGMLPFAPDRLAADRDGRPDRLPGLLHPRGRQEARPLPGAEAQHPGRAHRGTGNDGPVSAATASSFLNAAGPVGG